VRTDPVALQTVTVLAAGALMLLSGLKKRRLELRRPRRDRRRRRRS
jgi:hypothetical protein